MQSYGQLYSMSKSVGLLKLMPPNCLEISLDLDRIEYFKQSVLVLWRYLFIWACERLLIYKALQIDVWEMADSSEHTWSAHACDVSLGARICRHRTGSSLAQVMACLLPNGTKTLPDEILIPPILHEFFNTIKLWPHLPQVNELKQAPRF